MNLSISMLNGFMSNIFDFLMDVVNLIPKFVYFLTATAMGLLDIAQMMLRKLAGLDVHYVGDGSAQTGDIVISFIRGIFDENSKFPALKNAFWSLMILAVILLFVTTIIATIRQEYMPGKDEAKSRPSNSKMFVISRAIKSLFMFLIVPVSVMFGLVLSDVILVAMDAATSNTLSDSALQSGSEIRSVEGTDRVFYATDQLVAGAVGVGDNSKSSYNYYDFFGLGVPTTSVSISGVLFKVSGYMSNRVRIGKEYGDASFYELVKAGGVSNFGIFQMAESGHEMAQMIDEAFAGNVHLKTPEDLMFEGSPAYRDIKNPMIFPNNTIKSFSKYNVALIWYFYDLWQYNYIIAFAFLIIGLKLLVKIVFGLMKRIIEMVALFLISPPIIALMPLDSEKAFGQWRKSFIGKALSAYGAIIGMNLLFLLLPYLQDIKFIPENVSHVVAGIDVYSNGAVMVNLIISTLFILTGLTVVESFIGLLSGIIGADDVAKDGGELVGKVGETFSDAAVKASSTAGVASKALAAPFKITGAVAKKAGIIGGPKRRKLSEEQIKGISDSTKEAWETDDPDSDGGAAKAYNNYLSSNKDFTSGMKKSYDKRDDSMEDMSFEDWQASQGGIDAKDDITKQLAEEGKVQSFDDFAKAESGAGAEYLQNNISSNIEKSSYYSKEELEEKRTKRRERIANNRFLSGVRSVGGAIGNEVIDVGKHLSAYASQISAVSSDAFEGKLTGKTLTSMKQAWQGISKKDMEKLKKKDDLYKEERMRQDFYGPKKKSGEGDDGKKDEKSKIERNREIKEVLEEELKDIREGLKKQSETISKLNKDNK